MIEIWKTIKSKENNYQISNLGNIRNIKRNFKILKCKKNTDSYKNVVIDKKIYSIHRLVALYFIKNSDNKPQVNHKDGNKLNNNINNLEWVTISENIKHAYQNNLIKRKYNKNNKLNIWDIKFIKAWLKLGYKHKDIANKFNVSRSAITDINCNRRWRHINE